MLTHGANTRVYENFEEKEAHETIKVDEAS